MVVWWQTAANLHPTFTTQQACNELAEMLCCHNTISVLKLTLKYDFYVCSKADMSQFNLPHGTDN